MIGLYFLRFLLLLLEVIFIIFTSFALLIILLILLGFISFWLAGFPIREVLWPERKNYPKLIGDFDYDDNS